MANQTQVEHLDNHTARLTVDVEPERVEKAMKSAATKIAREVTIPGFRKGKAPYNVVLQRFGKQAVLSEAIDLLGNDIYREALSESKIEPYDIGSLENVETDPTLKLVFVVPKRPEVDLKDYREIRVPFETEPVTDEAVDKAMKNLVDSRALVETSLQPAKLGDQVKLNIDSTITHNHPDHDAEHEHDHSAEQASDTTAETTPAQAAEAESEHAHDEHEHDDHVHTEPYIQDEADIVLAEGDDEPVVPGFSAQIVGLNTGDEKEFTLDFPADHPDKNVAGHKFDFKVKVEEVKTRTLPVINDDFAKQVTNGEIDNLLSLRLDARRQLQEASDREAEGRYTDLVLDKIVDQASVQYPDAMVEEYLNDIIKELETRLKENNLTLNDLKRIEQKTDQQLRDQYRDTAIRRLERSLVLGEVVNAEKLEASDADIERQIDRMSARFGEQASVFRKILERGETRTQIGLDLITNRSMRRLLAIAKGENPPVGVDPKEEAELDAAAAAQAALTAPANAASTDTDIVVEGEVVSTETVSETDAASQPESNVAAESVVVEDAVVEEPAQTNDQPSSPAPVAETTDESEPKSSAE